MTGTAACSGFSNWIDFKAPISSITELWNLNQQSPQPPLLTDLFFTVLGKSNKLLGRWTTIGKSFCFQDGEEIMTMSVISANEKQPFHSRCIMGIESKTSHNRAVVLGLTGFASQASLKKAKGLDYLEDMFTDLLSVYGKLDPVIGAKRRRM